MSLKYDKNNRYFIWKSTYIYDISLNYSYNEKYFRQKLYSNTKDVFYVQYFFPKIIPFIRWCGTPWYSQTGHRWQHNMVQQRCDLHAGQLGRNKDTHTHNIQYLLLFHGNSGYTNGPQCCIIRTLSALFDKRRHLIFCRLYTEFNSTTHFFKTVENIALFPILITLIHKALLPIISNVCLSSTKSPI